MRRVSMLVAGLCALTAVPAAQAQPGGQPGVFPGGPFQMPKPGEILPSFLQDQLKLNAEQKKQLAELQKEVDARLAKILTPEQQKSLKEPQPRGFGVGGFGPPGFGPGGFGPGGFGTPGFGASSLDQVKKKLGASDEEWKVLGPKIQKVTSSRQALNAEAGRGFGSTGIVSQACAELQAVLDDPKHTKADVEEKIAAVRKARLKARADLEAAQKDLLLMVTKTQEAVLIGLGYLE